MNSALYEGYLALLAEGRRKDAGLMLDAFLRSFNSSEEREQWTRTFLKTHTYGARARHEIYAELIFPVLLAGSKRNDATLSITFGFGPRTDIMQMLWCIADLSSSDIAFAPAC